MASIFNSSSNNHSPYPSDHYHEDHQYLSPNYQASPPSNSLTTHLFLNSSDQNGFFNQELKPPHHRHEGDKFGSQTYKEHQTETNKNMNNGKGVEFSTWNKSGINNNMNNDLNEVKWMSSKMRVMLKMKKSNHVINPNNYSPTNREVKKLEDHKHPTSPMEETYNSSNNTSSNNSIPIRVCSDCNTTKTPLWRSGPQGPKSLCNACGIRQRKARRAMAAAAAAENGNSNVFIDQSIMRPLKVTKTQHKDHKKPHKLGQVTKYKKRQFSKQITPPSSPSPSPSPSNSSSPARKNFVEEYLVRLSKNLAFYHVFPQDEKEAAILLMALSCGYAHET
ncbi:GATA transcription factor 21-like [Bidens hawaiensis]|uniref:GATA transcription factor 21-like n=1 Tax=Bidens hawaiensis TaxID=980011 RepID=UPI004049FD2F